MSRITRTIHDTPVGPAVLVFVDDALVSLDLAHDGIDVSLAALGPRLGVLPEPDDAPAAALCAQLDEYFAGTRRQFEVALDWRLIGGFAREALETVRGIPYGETASYGEVAVMAGTPRAARAVGTACAKTPFSLVVPVHRVVRSDGSIGEYGGYPEVKRALLDHESRVLLGRSLRIPA